MQADASDPPVFNIAANAMHDLYDDNNDRRNIEVIWQYTHDADADPRYGDFGKVDLRGADRDGDVAGNDIWIRTARPTTTPGTPNLAVTPMAMAATPSGPWTTKFCSPTASSAAPQPGW